MDVRQASRFRAIGITASNDDGIQTHGRAFWYGIPRCAASILVCFRLILTYRAELIKASVFFLIVEDCYQYFVHRAMHWGPLYKVCFQCFQDISKNVSE